MCEVKTKYPTIQHRMTREVREVDIPSTLKAMIRLFPGEHWNDVRVREFKCTRCGLNWEPSIETLLDPTGATCSNCYGDDLRITKVSLEFIEQRWKPE